MDEKSKKVKKFKKCHSCKMVIESTIQFKFSRKSSHFLSHQFRRENESLTLRIKFDLVVPVECAHA